MNNYRAFTLAEVLITLAIIGIVAALTIPAIVNKYQKLVFETRLKKTYAEFNQAVKLSEAENGEMSLWEKPTQGWVGAQNKKYFEKYFKPYLKFSKYCGLDTGKKCYTNDYDNNAQMIKFILNNGVAVVGTWSSISFYWEVDLNGLQKPNKAGVDMFAFETKSGQFVPYIWSQTVYDKYGAEKANDRNYLKEVCESSALKCAGLLRHDNWEYKDDYPVKF